MVTKSPLRYVGGKTRAIKFLEQFVNSDVLVSPFLGGGSFELSCAERGIKVYGYDNFEALTDFWFYLQNEPITLANKVEEYYNIDREELKSWGKLLLQEQDRLMRAVRFFILNRTTFGGTTLNGGLYSNIYHRFNRRTIDRLREATLTNITIENMDFRQVLKKHSNKEQMYLDPPYVGQDRLYAYSKITKLEFPHQELAELLYKRDNWFMSYGDHPLIRKLYSGYTIIEPKWAYGIGQKKSKEILVLSHNLASPRK